MTPKIFDSFMEACVLCVGAAFLVLGAVLAATFVFIFGKALTYIFGFE